MSALERLLASREQTIASLRAAAPPTAVPAPPPAPIARLEQAPPPPPAAAGPPAPPLLVPELPPELEVSPGRWSLRALETAMARYPDDPAFEEWRAYAVFLRDHAGPDGVLSTDFDALVDEVYGGLIARVRAG